MTKTILTIEVEYDSEVTSAENIGHTLDAVLTDAYADCFEELHGEPTFHGFQVESRNSKDSGR